MANRIREAARDQSDNQLADAVRASAEQIWLAGLGAFAKAQEEGSKVFEALVREGDMLQRRTRSATENRLEEATGRFTDAAGQLTRQATHSWDRLEQVFEDRVARALARLGVPGPRAIGELTALLESLTDKIEALDVQSPQEHRATARATEAADAADPARPAAGTEAGRTVAAAEAGGVPGERRRRAPSGVRTEKSARTGAASRAPGAAGSSETSAPRRRRSTHAQTKS